jgi:hypothetical protein
MANRSIHRNEVHPLASSPLLEFPLEAHGFDPGVSDAEKCALCGRNRAMHAESDTVSPWCYARTKAKTNR